MGANMNVPELALTSILLLRFTSCTTPPPVCSLYTLAYQGGASPTPAQGARELQPAALLPIWLPG